MTPENIESILQTDEAFFVFQLVRTNSLIYVHVNNPYAIICMEKLSTSQDNYPKHHKLHSVMSTLDGTLITYPGIKEVPFPDFIIDIYGFEALYRSYFIYQTFLRGLRPEEVKYVMEKIQALIDMEDQNQEQVSHVSKHVVVIPKKSIPGYKTENEYNDCQEDDVDGSTIRPSGTAISALVSLGFKKNNVEKWANKFDATGKTTSEVVKDGCMMLSSNRS